MKMQPITASNCLWLIIIEIVGTKIFISFSEEFSFSTSLYVITKPVTSFLLLRAYYGALIWKVKLLFSISILFELCIKLMVVDRRWQIFWIRLSFWTEIKSFKVVQYSVQFLFNVLLYYLAVKENFLRHSPFFYTSIFSICTMMKLDKNQKIRFLSLKEKNILRKTIQNKW